MSQDTERIRVGEEADGGEPVELPVIDVLAGRGFITGKSGSGKSNTASVVAEQLLEAGYGLLIVDVDGEYYGLKEEYELLHAGADEECDIRVSPEHAEKLASLALEENVPIILDVSSYLDPDDADEMLLAVARQLFAKAKKQKKPFLVLVEECHEYIPEGGGMTETGKMLIKIGKRGRKHGLGIVGMSQRPADVKKDFITQCDWMVWHRLTWDNDTRVVGRILGSEYAGRVEELGDGEAFLDTDWTDTLRRVQFDRKRTFDAGATPGLEEFERPDLQSVSEDLVADLQQVSEERERHESELQALEAELAEKEQRIEELEAELAEARDMSEMADRFAQALVENTDSPPGDAEAAESDVAEAERFVADDRPPAEAVVADSPRAGYPGTEPGSGADEREAVVAPPETDDESERTLLPEAQRDLHAYAVSDGGAPDEETASETTATDAPENEAEASEPETSEPETSEPAVDESEADEPEADQLDANGTDAEPNEGKTDDESSGLQPVRTVSRGRSAEEADENPADETAAEEPEAPVKPTPAEETEAEGASGDDRTEGTSEGADEPGAAPDPSSAETAGTDETTLDQESGTDDAASTESAENAERQKSEPTAPAERAAGDEPIEATGDWPTPAGERSAPVDESVDLEPPEDPERAAELERQLSEEFGVIMESGSDLTGGSLGSSAPDRSGDSRDEQGDAPETESATDTGVEDYSAEETDAAESENDSNGETVDSTVDPTADRGERFTELVEGTELRNEAGVVQVFVRGIEAFDEVTRGMLEHYRNTERAAPVDAHVAAGGSGERQYAYARNRTLRTAGLVEHVGGGRYRYRLPDLVAELLDGNTDETTVSETVSAIEAAVGLSE